MNWVRKWHDKQWDGVEAEYVIEGDLVAASATLTQAGWSAWWPTGHRNYPAYVPAEVVLADVQAELVTGLREVLALAQKPFGVEAESCPVEVLAGSQNKGNYPDGWLVVREGRKMPARWIDHITLDDGRVANIHPFSHAGDLARDLGVGTGTLVAGVRWFDRPRAKA